MPIASPVPDEIYTPHEHCHHSAQGYLHHYPLRPDTCTDAVKPAAFGLGHHPVLARAHVSHLHVTLTLAGLHLIDYLYERVRTGVDPDTGRPDYLVRGELVPGPTSAGEPLGRWTGVTWDDVARVVMHACWGPTRWTGRRRLRPVHVDLDAQDAAAPWEQDSSAGALSCSMGDK